MIYRFNGISIEITKAFLQKNYSAIHKEPKKMSSSQTILSRTNKAEGITLPDFETYYKPTIIKTVLAHKQLDQ